MKKQLLFTTVLLITSISSFGQFKLDATGTNDMRLRTNNLDRLNILTNGRVGIGTSTPYSKLHVQNGYAGTFEYLVQPIASFESNVNGYLNVLTPETSEGGILFASPKILSYGFVVYDNALSKMSLGTGGLVKMVIDGSGNVGIGTFPPQAKLDVNGDIRLTMTSITPATNSTIDPLNRQSKSYVSINAAAGVTTTISGISAPTITTSYGTMLYITCGANAYVTLKNNASAVTANNIQTPTGGDVTLLGRGGVTLAYDVDGWRVISVAN